MSIKIGHASADERYKASGGAAGDQTGGEVCIREWYSSPWHFVLRPKSPKVAEKSAAACEAACGNKHVGYDQSSRNTIYIYAKLVNFDLGKIEDDCECDCSSLMHVCAIAGGAKLDYGVNGLWTGNMVEAFEASGDYEVLTDAKYLNSDAYLKRGDILVNRDKHTAMVLENGAMAGDERGVEDAAPYEDAAYLHPTVGTQVIVWLPLVKKGSTGAAVWTLQQLLTAMGYDPEGVDGIFGADTEAAVMEYQRDHELESDGECGKLTWTSIING